LLFFLFFFPPSLCFYIGVFEKELKYISTAKSLSAMYKFSLALVVAGNNQAFF